MTNKDMVKSILREQEYLLRARQGVDRVCTEVQRLLSHATNERVQLKLASTHGYIALAISALESAAVDFYRAGHYAHDALTAEKPKPIDTYAQIESAFDKIRDAFGLLPEGPEGGPLMQVSQLLYDAMEDLAPIERDGT